MGERNHLWTGSFAGGAAVLEVFFETAGVPLHFQLLSQFEEEAKQLVDAGLLLAAYDYCLKCSHVFNTLEARGAISVTERTGSLRGSEILCAALRRSNGKELDA